VAPPVHSLRRDDPKEIALAEAVLRPFHTQKNRSGGNPKLKVVTDAKTGRPEYIYNVAKHKRGKRAVYWHGTTEEGLTGILEGGFQISVQGLLGPGVYVGNREKAINYARQFMGRYHVLLKVAADFRRVIQIDEWKENPRTPHDTVYCPAGTNKWAWGGGIKHEEWCVRNPADVTVLAVHLITR